MSEAIQGDAAALIDLARLMEWMDGQGLGRGAIGEHRLLAGGTQNVLMLFERGGRRYVLRRPPPTPRPESNRVMQREAQVLRALADTDVPHPGLIALCDDTAVLGAVFYLMEPIDGFNPTTEMPALHAGDPAVRHAMGLAMVDCALALGRVDPARPELAGLGRPEDFLRRQVDRWQSHLAGYDAFPEWHGRAELPGVDEIGAYLAANCPASFRPGLIHGDFHMGNVMFRTDGPQLAAAIDWELATIGDPLLDLAWLIATSRGVGEDDVDLIAITPSDGFPTPDEMIARYAAGSDRDLSAIDWYVVLACYKLAIIIEGTFARASAGQAPMATGERLHRSAQQLLRRALRRLER